MLLDSLGKRRKLLYGVILSMCLAFSVFLFFHDSSFVLTRRANYSVKDKDRFNEGHFVKSRDKKVLLPVGIKFSKRALKKHFKGTSGQNRKILQLTESEVIRTPPIEPGVFEAKEAVLFTSSGETSEETDCTKNSHKFKFFTDESKKLSVDLTETFRIFKEEAEVYGDTYNQRLESVFGEYMTKGRIPIHWYRFLGSSVWLKDYNIHFVVSRLMFTETGVRKLPRLSMLYAQIFDENWNEIRDAHLVFPTNEVKHSPSFQVKRQHYRSYRFPRVLPAPFDIGNEGFYWGAEDPRMVLVRNENKYEEPMVLFNAIRDKEVADAESTKLVQYRSIFMTFPFQVQEGKKEKEGRKEKEGEKEKGKEKVREDIKEEKIKNGREVHKRKEPQKKISARTVEQSLMTEHQHASRRFFSLTKLLIVSGQPEKRVEKNWSPFVSRSGTYDKHIMMVTSLEPLRVIRCELWSNNGLCTSEQDHKIDEIGPLRGGTPLLSIRKSEADNAEYFLGLARAHLTSCGCAGHFYRPNLILVARKGAEWRLSHISSSLDLGMEVLPWNKDDTVCKEGMVNAMIPNGIEWIDHEHDLLSVHVSVSDLTVERVTVHGLLKALNDMKYWQAAETKAAETKVFISPERCALEASVDFCKEYGVQNSKKKRARNIRGFYRIR